MEAIAVAIEQYAIITQQKLYVPILNTITKNGDYQQILNLVIFMTFQKIKVHPV